MFTVTANPAAVSHFSPLSDTSTPFLSLSFHIVGLRNCNSEVLGSHLSTFKGRGLYHVSRRQVADSALQAALRLGVQRAVSRSDKGSGDLRFLPPPPGRPGSEQQPQGMGSPASPRTAASRHIARWGRPPCGVLPSPGPFLETRNIPTERLQWSFFQTWFTCNRFQGESRLWHPGGLRSELLPALCCAKPSGRVQSAPGGSVPQS